MNKSSIPGIYQRRLSVDIQDITRYRRLFNYIKLYYRRHKSEFDFAPEIYTILDSLPSLPFVPSFFLAYTLCRVNELTQIKILDLKSGVPIEIKSSKSKHIRQHPGFHPFKKKTLLAVPDDAQILVISYDHLKNSIKSSRDFNKIKLPGAHLDATHIFRHLQASYLNSIGIPISEISYRLGHVIDKTTKEYIHESLYL